MLMYRHICNWKHDDSHLNSTNACPLIFSVNSLTLTPSLWLVIKRPNTLVRSSTVTFLWRFLIYSTCNYISNVIITGLFSSSYYTFVGSPIWYCPNLGRALISARVSLCLWITGSGRRGTEELSSSVPLLPEPVLVYSWLTPGKCMGGVRWCQIRLTFTVHYCPPNCTAILNKFFGSFEFTVMSDLMEVMKCNLESSVRWSNLISDAILLAKARDIELQGKKASI